LIKVLIIKLSSIGDVVHTLPALKALRDGLGPAAELIPIDRHVVDAGRLNAGVDRRQKEDGVPLDTYSLDLKLRFEY